MTNQRPLLWSCDFQRRPLIGRNFSLQIWHIWAILRPFYPWSFFDSGIISKKKSQKTHFWVPFHKFFSRILNNSSEKWDFSKEMSRLKVQRWLDYMITFSAVIIFHHNNNIDADILYIWRVINQLRFLLHSKHIMLKLQ